MLGSSSMTNPKDMLQQLERVGAFAKAEDAMTDEGNAANTPKGKGAKDDAKKDKSAKDKKAAGKAKAAAKPATLKRPAGHVVVKGKKLPLGCSKCRGNPTGCSVCRDPSFVGKRGASTYKPKR